MSATLPSIPGRLASAVFEVPNPEVTLGPALWLYVYFLSRIGHRGRLCRKSEEIARDLGLAEDEVQARLETLVSVGLVLLLSPAPFLAIKLRFWPGSEPDPAAEEPSNGGPSRAAQEEVPVSSSAAAAAAAAAFNNHGEDGGRGEGEALLGEVLDVLGEGDPAELGTLLEQYSADVVRRALLRVQATPAGRIRKSRVALFRYLLAKLS